MRKTILLKTLKKIAKKMQKGQKHNSLSVSLTEQTFFLESQKFFCEKLYFYLDFSTLARPDKCSKVSYILKKSWDIEDLDTRPLLQIRRVKKGNFFSSHYLTIFPKYMSHLNAYQDGKELKNPNKSMNFHEKISGILENFLFSLRERERITFFIFFAIFNNFFAESFYSYKRVTLQQFIKKKFHGNIVLKKS